MMTRGQKRSYLELSASTGASGSTGSLRDVLWLRVSSHQRNFRLYSYPMCPWILDVTLCFLDLSSIISLANCLVWNRRMELLQRPPVIAKRSEKWVLDQLLRQRVDPNLVMGINCLVLRFFESYSPGEDPEDDGSGAHPPGFGLKDLLRNLPRITAYSLHMATRYLKEEGYIYSTVDDHHFRATGNP